MDLATYQVEARVTQVFNPIHNITYPTLGLCDEAAEFVEKYDDFTCSDEDLAKELGDVLWYFNCVCDYSNFSITDFFTHYVVTNPVNFLIYAGKIAGVAKKAVRDNNGAVNEDKMRPLLTTFSAMIVYFIRCDLSDYTLEDIMDMNIAKLRDRQNRGVLKGEGDNR